jgi:LysM repeat protein
MEFRRVKPYLSFANPKLNPMQYRPLIWLSLWTVFLPNALFSQVPVPDQMQYCGIDLTLTPAAKSIIEDYVAKIYESPRYFNEMVKRGMIYMPFIEEAFDNVGVPQDLKYLAIQESALRPDVISSSNAVGFWQFKEPTALEYGLRVDDKVDERQHIYRASEAAATYLANANRDFDNWLYAVLAYYEGLTGAVSHTDPVYYSSRQMVIKESLHWYVLKAIAHKIAYEGALSMQKLPPLFLKPHSNEGESNISKLIDEHGLGEDEFFEYNRWILNSKRLPKGALFTYYVPQPAARYTGHIPDPNKVTGGGTPLIDPNTQVSNTIANQSAFQQPVPTELTEPVKTVPTPAVVASASTNIVPDQSPKETVIPPTKPRVVAGEIQMPKARKVSGLNQFSYVEFTIQHDLHYGKQFVYYDGSMLVVEIANLYKKRLTDVLVWNGLIPGEEPRKGSMVYLEKPSKLEHHIVRTGETLFDIAALHLTTVKKLQKLNRISRGDYTIYVGQKLYLKDKKPRNEKLIILNPAKKNEVNYPTRPAKNTAANSEQEIQQDLNKIVDLAASTPRPQIIDGKTPDAQDNSNLSALGQQTSGGNSMQDMQKRWVQHVVKPGETLWSISKLYKTKVPIIKQINKLETDNIHEGQTLRILAEI